MSNLKLQDLIDAMSLEFDDSIMQAETGKYIEIPTKWQINEYRIMEKFCSTISSERIQKNSISMVCCK